MPTTEQTSPVESSQVIRESAKWLLAAFAGIGATMVAGVQLSDIGTLRSPSRLVLAAAGVVAVLTAVTIVILKAAKVITLKFLTTREVNLERHEAAKQVAGTDRSPSEVSPFLRALEVEWSYLFLAETKSLAELARLQEDVQEAMARLDRGESVQWRGRRVLPAAKSEVEADAQRLRVAGERVVMWANTWCARQEFDALIPLIRIAGSVITAGLVLFIWAVNPSPDTAFARVDEPAEVTVTWTEEALQHVDENVPEECIDEGGSSSAIAIGGDLGHPEVVLPPSGDCPGALLTVEDDAGVVVPILEGTIED